MTADTEYANDKRHFIDSNKVQAYKVKKTTREKEELRSEATVENSCCAVLCLAVEDISVILLIDSVFVSMWLIIIIIIIIIITIISLLGNTNSTTSKY